MLRYTRLRAERCIAPTHYIEAVSMPARTRSDAGDSREGACHEALAPAPLLSLALFALWLLLNQSLESGQSLLARLRRIAVPLLIAPLRPAPRRACAGRVLVLR